MGADKGRPMPICGALAVIVIGADDLGGEWGVGVMGSSVVSVWASEIGT